MTNLKPTREELEARRQTLYDQLGYHQRRYDALHEHQDYRQAHAIKARIFDIDEQLRELAR